MTSIPYKYSPDRFRLAAPYIGKALDSWPAAVFVPPDASYWGASLSPDTVVEYLRRGIKGKLLYGYGHSCIDEVKWNAHAEQLTIAVHKDGAIMGPKEAVRAKAPKQVTVSVLDAVRVKAHDNLDDYTIALRLAELVALRVMSPEPSFIVGPLTDNEVKTIEHHHEVVLQPIGDNCYRLL